MATAHTANGAATPRNQFPQDQGAKSHTERNQILNVTSPQRPFATGWGNGATHYGEDPRPQQRAQDHEVDGTDRLGRMPEERLLLAQRVLRRGFQGQRCGILQLK